MDLAKLYSDKATFPDEMTVEIQGEKMSLKEWRDGLGLKSEFTKHTQELSGKQRQMETIIQQQQQAQQQLQGQLAQAMQARGVDPRNAQDDDLAAYRSDPAFGPLVKLIENQQGTIGQLAQRMQMDEISMNSYRYQQQLDRLKEKDPDLNPQELAEFTRAMYSKGPDIDTAYRLHTEDRRMKKLEADAEKRGYEKAKSEPPIPPQPGGRRGSGAPAPELPKDWNSRAALALQEFGPDLQEALQNRT
jgi:hypothetical protein